MNKLRDLGYRFKREGKRTRIWAKAALPPVLVPKRNLLEEGWVYSQLRHLGLAEEAIKSFLAQNRA